LCRGAISTAGEFLRENDDPALLKSLLNSFENSSDRSVKEMAYRALLRASGIEHSEMPNPAKPIPQHKFDRQAIEKTIARLESKKH
jgi:hypothetical protein